MKIYDISQELFTGRVYPGDPPPKSYKALKMSEGAICNLTMVEMGAHNATHLDAPYHFYEEGKTVEELELSRCIGPCTVINLDFDNLKEASERLKSCRKRLLLKGTPAITLEVAKLLNEMEFVLIGVESQSVGQEDSVKAVHLELLGREVILLEGLVLDQIEQGDYFLFAPPLKLGNSDGAPCRAILLNLDEIYL